MKLKTVTDPRAVTLPLVLDDDGLAQQVKNAPTPEAAWRQLGLPGDRRDVDPAILDRLLAATGGVTAASDAIGKGLIAFGALDPEDDPPPSWVDRIVTLYVEELEAFWLLDDLAWEGLCTGGWTASQPGRPPLDLNPAQRIATRARWQAEHLKPKHPALWWDKLDRLLTEATTSVEAAREVGRTLVETAARKRFAAWRNTRTEARR